MGKIQRFGQLIRVKKEKLDYYKELHANPWPCVLETIKKCNIRNYSIFLTPDLQLFAYFEYTGDNFEADMKKMAEDECTQKWWKETGPCQESVSGNDKEWWLNLEEVFHMD
jgi:L-rhamnose mutarotase